MQLTPQNIKALELEYRRRSASDLLLFASGLIIPSATGPQLFNTCMVPFQRECFTSVGPSLWAVRNGRKPPTRRFWLERTKKSAKDSDIAICLLWVTAFSERPILAQVCAANQKQAGIIKHRMVDIVHYNQWLYDYVELRQHSVVNKTKPELIRTLIEATDSRGGAHGETPDVLVLNELVHVAKWQAMEDHMNNADGVPRGIVIISTNAGFKGTKAEVWRKIAINNRKKWAVQIWSKKSPWLDKDDVKDAAERNTASEYNRLFGGRWSSGKGDALSDELIDSVFQPKTNPHLMRKKGLAYIGGLDLGISHDHAGLVILGIDRLEQRVHVAFIQSWEPEVPNDAGQLEVDLDAVEEACFLAYKGFRLTWFGYDPAAGGSFMAQRLRKRKVPMREMKFSGPNLNKMAVCLKQAIEEKKLVSFEDDRLRRDFGKFNIVKKSYGYKLEAVSDEYGHADVGTALVIALPRAMQMIEGWGRWDDDDVIADPDLDSLQTEEEIDELPDELRDIYEMQDELAEEIRIERAWKEK